jgi:hypothetical protein
VKRLALVLPVLFATGVLLAPGPAHSQQAAAPPHTIILQTGTVLDGRGHVLRNTRIVIENGKIARLDSNARGATYDLRGLTVLPPGGLRDEGWCHLPQRRAGKGGPAN